MKLTSEVAELVSFQLTTALKRPSLKDLKPLRLALDILRSSLFLTTNAFFFLSSLCVVRRVLRQLELI